MKTLIKNHYVLTKQRGLITPETTLEDFMNKMYEEFEEVVNAYCDFMEDPYRVITDEFWHECTDLAMVILNMMQHFGIDFKDELAKNVKIQEGKL